MFKRDIDQFRFGNDPRRFMGQGPNRPHEHPDSPPHGSSFPHGQFPRFIPPLFGVPLPIGREAFREMRDFILLLLISEYPNGITGYQLQESYKFSRGTLIRTLQDLENKNYLNSREEIIDGRANKFYMITEAGKKFLEKLKMKWANLFGTMAELTPPEKYGTPLRIPKEFIIAQIELLKSKEDALDLFRGIRSKMKTLLAKMAERRDFFEKKKVELDSMILKIEEMDEFSIEEIKEMIEENND